MLMEARTKVPYHLFLTSFHEALLAQQQHLKPIHYMDDLNRALSFKSFNFTRETHQGLFKANRSGVNENLSTDTEGKAQCISQIGCPSDET